MPWCTQTLSWPPSAPCNMAHTGNSHNCSAPREHTQTGEHLHTLSHTADHFRAVHSSASFVSLSIFCVFAPQASRIQRTDSFPALDLPAPRPDPVSHVCSCVCLRSFPSRSSSPVGFPHPCNPIYIESVCMVPQQGVINAPPAAAHTNPHVRIPYD